MESMDNLFSLKLKVRGQLFVLNLLVSGFIILFFANCSTVGTKMEEQSENLDLSISYYFKNFTFESGINNLLNEKYFTRRATGYPGPGIIPSSPRTFYLTVEIKI